MDWDIGDIFGSRWRIGRKIGKARVVGGGVEAGGGRDKFAGGFHAHEHFATGFVVVAGGGENFFDGTGLGTFV